MKLCLFCAVSPFVAGRRRAHHHRNFGRMIPMLVGAALVALLTPISAIADGSGSLDRGFGGDGLVTDGVGRGTSAWVQGLVVQPDGQLVLATGDRIVRYLGNGERDRSFIVRHVPVVDLAETSGGDLIRIAESEVERLLPDGEPDPGFGAAGDGLAEVPGLQFLAVAVDSAERIVVVGRDRDAHLLAVARFLPDGSLDQEFGDRGIVRTAVSADSPANLDFAESVSVASDGSILVGGSAGQAEVCPPGPYHCWGPYLNAVVLRYLPDGRLDTGFGEGGVFQGGSFWGSAQSIAARPEGGMLFVPGGPTGVVEPGGGPGFVAAALNAAGEREQSFENVASAHPFDQVQRGRDSPHSNRLVVDAAGRTLVCGGVEGSRHGLLLLAMLRDDGKLARSFGHGGLVVTRLGRNVPGSVGAEALAVAPGQKLYVAGHVGRRLFVARYRLRAAGLR